MKTNHEYRINRIFFDVPFRVQPNVVCHVKVSFSSVAQCICGNKGIKQITKDGVSFTFSDLYHGSNAVEGLIPKILFKHC
uniref:PHR domain-containing protein n=1 Tax=Lepeophtheirus salmonis TaxID=72036 RepID=A0A0K2UC21_LEPSM